MSANSDTDGSSGREVARRTFAREFNDATYTFKESDDELAPNYTLLPTGERANRVFFVGTLTETEDVGSDSEYWQGHVVDPTGTFYVYAGQYQPEAASTLRQIEPPTYVAVVGKPRGYETDDGSMNVAVRPESITQVDEPTRNRWVVETADQTIERLEAFDDETNDYAQMAREEYGGSISPYREEAIAALESLDESDDRADEPTTEDEESMIGSEPDQL
jgi:RPA family protein